MAENNEDRARRETGITEAQAHELMDLIGNDRNSLLREARLLARKQK
ncbi:MULTISPECIES: hypothetical protein [unclassified Mesorhizobium]|nr:MULTISPECIES: hypothetical protein [unclassified Mesorhizobium]